MRTLLELRAARNAAGKRENLASMRECALEFRMAIAPDTYRSLTQRGEDGVESLKLAMGYRNMARDLGKWRRTVAV